LPAPTRRRSETTKEENTADDKEYNLLIKNVRMVRPNIDSVEDVDIAVKDVKIHRTGINIDADIALVHPGETRFIDSKESESGQGYTPSKAWRRMPA
jgi:dihydroorotase-like cyclic amidohydrolase